ncbi:hypothetical protein [Candidatus Amarobacter glycogenicus]|uniref:hypothetical protein n=1 Tax=Candidatus Amarobacter glycogenicus TaxID=3140699 RepID=UPI00313650A1|nr:hypothetical protein [Dehalococcoidia bacterium]
MKHDDSARLFTAGALMLLGLLLFLQHRAIAQSQPTLTEAVVLPAFDRTARHAAPTITVTLTPVYRAGSVEAFMSPAHILTSIQWDELNALNQSSWAQSLAPQTDCTGVTNGACVETRAGLSLCNLNNICVIKVDLNRNTLQPRVVIAPSGGTAWLSSMASSVGGIAAINGDYFSGCPDTPPLPLNCGEGLDVCRGDRFYGLQRFRMAE